MDEGELHPPEVAPPTALGSAWPPPRLLRTPLDDAFIASIRETPEDDTPRLIYADWLMDQDDPRGLFIRLDIEIHHERDPLRLRALLRDRRRLLQHYEEYWSPGERVTAIGGFTRGFLDTVTMTPLQLISHGEWVFAREPIYELRLQYSGTHPSDELIRCSCLHHVQRLHTAFRQEDAIWLLHLFRANPWDRLQALTILDLNNQPLALASVRRLTRQPFFRDLRTLRLPGQNAIGLQVLLDGPGFAIERLEVPGSQREIEGDRAWDDESPAVVDVPSIGREGLELLLTHPAAQLLRYLDASHNPVSLVLDRLIASPNLPHLETIRVGPREEIDVRALREAGT